MGNHILISCRENKIIYNAYNLVKAFFPGADVKSRVCEDQEPAIIAAAENGEAAEKAAETAEAQAADHCIRPQQADISEKISLAVDDIRELYCALRKITGQELPWGMLTGVRPVKLATGWIEEHLHEYASAGPARDSFIKWFYNDRFVSRRKAGIAFDIALKEKQIIDGIMTEQNQPQGNSAMPGCIEHKYLPESGIIPGYSLYISIPFCPSVCSYCSFSSGSIKQYADRVDEYLDALVTEMEKRRIKDFSPTSVYIGGGTPTALSEHQLERLLSEIERIFSIKNGIAEGLIKEYTVEAGRPDSINKRKLEIIKEFGAGRISVNPQSMQLKTMEAIGRRHTPQQTEEAFLLAREMGFDNINMDLIMGLPGEDNDDVRDTLEKIISLNPDSLTVHSLAVKRSSFMGIAGRTGKGGHPETAVQKENARARVDISEMIEDAYGAAARMGMHPYYLYRQKSIAGNFENTGFSRSGKEGLYNIIMMEEVQSVVGLGAGASSKQVFPDEVGNPARKGQMTRIVRSENVKNINEYISRQKCSEN